jgi:hypothetical protein
VASFFLWNIGSVEQSSQEGLARGLLYHVLTKNPALIPKLLPQMWQEAQIGITELSLPTNIKMKTAFRQLGAETTTGAFAFFIDGLDEFTGNHRDGISFVKSLVSSTNIKVLVSSRPLDTCVAAFSAAPKLRLQDLTKPDIERYVSDTVCSHPYVVDHNYVSDTAVEGLVKDIQGKANGVFLWVVLACRALQDGFDAFDNEEELRRRVDELPPELESLFRHILISLPSRFLQQTAKLLRICYAHHELEFSKTISAFVLAWAHENDMRMSALDRFEMWSLEKRKQQVLMLEGRLRSRCRGLLEVHKNAKAKDFVVDFMHRTVFEYLSTPHVWEMKCLQVDDQDFDVVTVLAYMSSYRLCSEWSPAVRGGSLVKQASADLEAIERTSASRLPNILKRIASVFKRPTDSEPAFFGTFQQSLSVEDAAVILASEFRLTSFVRDYDIRAFSGRSKLLYSNTPRYSLLYHTLRRPLLHNDSEACDQHDRRLATIVDHLVRSGCNPEDAVSEASEDEGSTCPWDVWMNFGHENCCNSGMQCAEITMYMIRAGKYAFYDKARLLELCNRWQETSVRFLNEQDQAKLEALCNEIKEAISACERKRSQLFQFNELLLS